MAVSTKVQTLGVLTFFENGKMDPIKFRYHGRVYPVKRIHRQWTDGDAGAERQHFLVETQDERQVELRYDSRRQHWDLTMHA